MKKLRFQPTFASLTDAELEQLAAAVQRETYDAVRERICKPRSEGGLDLHFTSNSPLVRLHEKKNRLDLINARLCAECADHKKLTLTDLNTFTSGEKRAPEEIHDAIMGATYELVTERDNTPHQLIALQRLADFPARVDYRDHKIEMDQFRKHMATERLELQKRALTLREKALDHRVSLDAFHPNPNSPTSTSRDPINDTHTTPADQHAQVSTTENTSAPLYLELQEKSGMEKWESRQVGRRQVITFCAQKSDFVAEIVAPPSSFELTCRTVSWLRRFWREAAYLQEWLSARVPNRLVTPIKDIAMTKPILGVDIAKDKFDALLLLNEQQHRRNFNNTLAGWKQLVRWLQRLKVAAVHACMEATGRLWEGLAIHLQENGHEVSVVNPVRIKRYAQSRMARNKNDEVDALLVALFCREQQPLLWKAPSAERRQLQDLSRLLFSRKQQLQQEKNRLKSGVQTSPVVREIKTLIQNLNQAVRRLELEIKTLLAQTTELKEKAALLKSIPGISDRTAAVILAELPAVEDFDRAAQVAAYAGLSPAQRQSGTSLRGKTRLCKTGNWRLRQALYLPAVVASGCNPLLKTRAERLRASGKTKMCVVGAIMHHLLRLAYGVLKHKQPFNPNFAVQPPSA